MLERRGDRPAGEAPLKQAAAAGVRWSFLGFGTRMGVQLAMTAVLAWLLDASDFGVVAMSLPVVVFVTVFRDLGTGAAVIQRQDLDRDALSTLFWANCLLGFVLAVAVALTAPGVARFFDEPQLAGILQVLSFGFLLQGIGTVHQGLLQKQLRFARITRNEILAQLSGAGVALYAALSGLGPWSLVLQTVTSSAVASLLMVAGCGFWPRLVLKPAVLRSVAGFSLNLTGFNLFNWFIRHLDHVLVGHYFGATVLGYYALAYRLILFPLQGVSGVVARVMFPVFARMKDDPERLRSAYLRVTTTIGIVLFPVMVGIAIVIGPLVSAVYGESWMPVVPLIQIFALVGIVQTVCSTVGVLYQAVGRTDLVFYWALVTGTLFTAGVFIGLQWGILGVATAFAVVSLATAWPSLAIPYRLIGLRVATLLEHLTRPLLATAIMTGATLSLDHLARGRLGPLAHLTIVIAGGVVSYALANLLVNRHLVGEICTLILPARRRA